MIPIKTLSFCITCKNRFHQISQTLKKNLDDNRLHNDWIEFILVDFGSTDGLHDWIIDNFDDDLNSGYLKYYYTDELTYWHASIGKNTAHYCANHEIVVNLDCDNFVGYLGGQFVIQNFLRNENIVLHQFSGNYTDGSFGRISVLKNYFDFIGGYDESLNSIGYEDNDLINRLKMAGLHYILSPNSKYCSAIPNTKEEGMLNTNSSLTYNEINELNGRISNSNIEKGKLIANNGIYGIRKNLFDHHGHLFSKLNEINRHSTKTTK